MGVAWLEDFRAALTRVLNIKGEGPPPYIPISNDLQLTYDVTEIVGADSESRTNAYLRSVLGQNLDLLQQVGGDFGNIAESPNQIPGDYNVKYIGKVNNFSYIHENVGDVNAGYGFGHVILAGTPGTYKVDVGVGLKAIDIDYSNDIILCVATVNHRGHYRYTSTWGNLQMFAPNKYSAHVTGNDLTVAGSVITGFSAPGIYLCGCILNRKINPGKSWIYGSFLKISDKSITFPLISNF